MGTLVRTLLLLAISWSVTVGAQAVSDIEPPLQYRRWLIPADLGPFGPGRYFEMKRTTFEDMVSRLENYSESPSDVVLSQTVLQARLDGRQLVDGRGYFEFRDFEVSTTEDSEYRHFPLTPLGLWISSPILDDDTEAAIALSSTGETCLVVPETAFRQSKTKRVRFHWSLRSLDNTQGQFLFDFQLPSCIRTEIRLDLPSTMIPTVPVGIVLQDDEQSTSEFKRWRILFNGNSRTTVTLSFDERLDASPKTTVQQLIVYNLSAQEMKTTSRIDFDKVDPLPNDLLLELESPLQPTEVKYGDQTVPWMVSLSTEDAVWILVDLSNVDRNDSYRLSVISQTPFPTDRLWNLPRVRILSSNIFWKETRGVVVVQRPLLTNKLLPKHAIQVSPIASADQTDRDVFAFQYFDANAQLFLDVGYFLPKITVDTATQIVWGNNETTGNMTLDVSLSEGDRYALEFSVAPRWTIDSVKSLSGDDLRSWDILDDQETEPPISADSSTKNKMLTILLKRPLRPKEGIRLHIGARYYPPTSQQDFGAAEFVPLLLERKAGEKHFVAMNADSPQRFRIASPTTPARKIHDVNDPQIQGRFAEPPLGTILPLDAQTQEFRVRLESLKPNYAVNIAQTVQFKEREIGTSFVFRCQPTDSFVDKLYVSFSPSPGTAWTWTADKESLNPIQVRRLSEMEVEELFSEIGVHNEEPHDETWEIRPSTPQTQAFDIQATTAIPVPQPIPVPLAYLPQAASQKAEIVVESPREYFYQLVNHRLTAIPTVSPNWNQYQIVRAAFRYDPREDVLFSSEPPLSIIPINPKDAPAAAWVWSLRLDSQFEAEGTVRNTALLLLENRGKNVLRVTLPDDVRSADIFAVRVGDGRGNWSMETGVSRASNILLVPLPEGRRFVAVSLEYSFRELPLTQKRKLHPQYPQVDVPVLSKNWTSWFPPEYEVCPKKQPKPVQPSLIPVTMSNLFAGGRFAPLAWNDWNVLATKHQRREQAVAASRAFFRWIGRNQTTGSPSTGNAPTWEQILGDEHLLTELLNDKGPIRSTVKIDRQAVAAFDVFPSASIFRSNASDAAVRGADAFSHAGLVLFVCPPTNRSDNGEYVFYITSLLSAAIHHTEDTELLESRVRFLANPPTASATETSSLGERLSPTPQTSPPQWIDLSQWIRETAAPRSPWAVSLPIYRLASIAPDWAAFELPHGSYTTPLYIIHRKTYAAYHWIAFLAMLLLTWRRPLSSPILLLGFLFVFELIAKNVAPCFQGIPSGAFLGTLVSLGFVLVRAQIPTILRQRRREHSTESAARIPGKGRIVPSSFEVVDSTLLGRTELSVFVLILFFLGSGFAFAEEPPPVSTSKPSEPYRVFFSVKDDRTIGEDVYLTDEFLQKLEQKLQAVKPGSPQRWRIDKAEYVGSLAYDTLTQSLGIASLKAIYEISLEAENTTIQLPNLPLQSDSGKWDQTPIQPSWLADNSLVFNIENQEKGKHVLELMLTPTLVRRDDRWQASIDIPKIPNATLLLNVPSEAPPITISECFGTVTPNSTTSPTLYAEIGPSEKLAFSWMDEPSRSNQVAVEVNQLFRLRTRSGPVDAVVLHAVFRYRIDNGRIRQVLIQTDPRWQLSGRFECAEAVIEQVAPQYVSDGQSMPRREVYRLTFQTPVSGTLTIEADFVLKDFSGIGNVRLPQISAFQPRPSKSMLAIFKDSSIDLDLPSTETSVVFDSSLVGEERPGTTLDLLKIDPTWTMGISARKVLPILRFHRDVLFHYAETMFVATANCSSDGEMFQQTFFVPETIEPESVEVKDASNNPIEARWVTSKQVRDIDGENMKEHTLFFKRAIPGDYSLTISGRTPTTVQTGSRQRKANIPPILFEDVRLQEQSLNIFCTRMVIADEQTIPGWQQTDPPLERPAGFADAVALDSWTMSVDPMSAEASTPTEVLKSSRRLPTWTMVPNEPVVRGTQVTSMLSSQTGDAWELVLDGDWTITDGELETVRLRWDDQCGAPSSCEPPIEWKLEQNKGRSELVLVPKRPWSGKQRFRIRAPLTFTGSPVTFPNILSEHADIVQYVVLPSKSERETFVWDLAMLTPVEKKTSEPIVAMIDARLEENQHMDDGNNAESINSVTEFPRLVFQATGENVAIAIATKSNRPTASLYDVGLFVKNDGVLYGTATIDIQSRGHEGCVLRLPDGFDLIQMTCAGVASKGTRLSEGRWQIDLWSSDYPQRILVLFRGSLLPDIPRSDETIIDRLREKRTHLNVPLPILEGVDVQETLWTLSFEETRNVRPPRMEISSVPESTKNDLQAESSFLGVQQPILGVRGTATQLRLNLARLNNLLSILDAVPTPPAGKGSEVERWLTHWTREWWSVKKTVEVQLAELADVPVGEETGVILGVNDASKRPFRTFIELTGVPKTSFGSLLIREEPALNRLGAARNRSESERSFPMPTNSLILWGESLVGRASHLFGVAEGQLKELQLVSIPDPYRFVERFRFSGWLWTVPMAAVLLILCHARTVEIMRRFPHFVGMTFGFGLWSLFPSGPLGGVIVLLTLLSLSRSAWKPKGRLVRNDG